MNTKKRSVDEKFDFPRSAFIIIFVHSATMFCESVFTGVLPFYLVDKLKFTENEATVTFHAFQVFQYIFSVVGGILGDSSFGKYKVLLYSYLLIVLGFIILSVASAPPLHLPSQALTLLAFSTAYIGYGARVPCTRAIGGDQFLLPQQEKQLSLYFVLVFIFVSIGVTLAYFVSPILRKDVNCFGELSCYSLVFVVPSGVVLIGLVTFVATKRLFRIRNNEASITVKIVRCIFHALSTKLKSQEKKEHWLYCASDKYEIEFLDDIKPAFQVMFLYLPIILYGAALGAKSTTMAFQATRMNGEVAGYLIKPEHAFLVESVFQMLALSVFHYYVYPFLAKYFRVDTHLKKITIGISLAALSYYLSSIVEWNLETTYAPKPTEGIAHLRIYNTLDCKVIVTIEEQKISIDELAMWENLNIVVTDRKIFEFSADFEKCGWQHFSSKKISGKFDVQEKQVISLVLTEDCLSYNFVDDNSKSQSGNPLVRALIHKGTDDSEKVTMKIMRNGEVIQHVAIDKNITKSEFVEVNHGTYTLYLNDQQIQSKVALKQGGVYTALGHISNSSRMARMVTVTPPNSMHIFWILPQLMLFSASTSIIMPLSNEFLYSQAPSSMKSIMLSYYNIVLASGHLVVVVITNSHFFDRKVFLFLLYAVMVTIGTIIFALLAKTYKYRPMTEIIREQDDAPAENVDQHLE